MGIYKELTPTGAITRICCVSVAPGLTVLLDIGSIWSCWVYKLWCKCIVLVCDEIKSANLWYSSLEVDFTRSILTSHLETSQNIYDTSSLRRNLRCEWYSQLVFFIYNIRLQFWSRWDDRLRRGWLDRRKQWGWVRYRSRSWHRGWSRCRWPKQPQNIVNGTLLGLRRTRCSRGARSRCRTWTKDLRKQSLAILNNRRLDWWTIGCWGIISK